MVDGSTHSVIFRREFFFGHLDCWRHLASGKAVHFLPDFFLTENRLLQETCDGHLSCACDYRGAKVTDCFCFTCSCEGDSLVTCSPWPAKSLLYCNWSGGGLPCREDKYLHFRSSTLDHWTIVGGYPSSTNWSVWPGVLCIFCVVLIVWFWTCSCNTKAVVPLQMVWKKGTEVDGLASEREVATGLIGSLL